ncbi:hypothetical protein [Streptomyces sp. NPDC059071]|uniref:hypothetical protein n=1 Tax=unclassified Streptomyces TaxID=2593676 RepID=UPI00365CC633
MRPAGLASRGQAFHLTSELVFLPTYGSWLNWIESEFAALRYFALDGTYHRTHAEQNAAVAAHIRWRNATPNRRPVSRPSHRSANGPITRPRLRDDAQRQRSLPVARVRTATA